MARGYRNAHTIKANLKNILEKLQPQNGTQAVADAMRNGLVTSENSPFPQDHPIG